MSDELTELMLKSWIRITDRLPDPDRYIRVLIFTDGYIYDGNRQVFEIWTSLFFLPQEEQPDELLQATHWAVHPADLVGSDTG